MFQPCEKPIGFHYSFSAETGNLKMKAHMPIPMGATEVT